MGHKAGLILELITLQWLVVERCVTH